MNVPVMDAIWVALGAMLAGIVIGIAVTIIYMEGK